MGHWIAWSMLSSSSLLFCRHFCCGPPSLVLFAYSSASVRVDFFVLQFKTTLCGLFLCSSFFHYYFVVLFLLFNYFHYAHIWRCVYVRNCRAPQNIVANPVCNTLCSHLTIRFGYWPKPLCIIQQNKSCMVNFTKFVMPFRSTTSYWSVPNSVSIL